MISDDLDQLKKSAATEAAQFIRNGMVVGLGTGSTAKHMIRALGEKVRAGMNLRGVPTSQETAALAKQAGIPLLEADNRWEIDVAIDGADQVDPQFNLIKGGGGALLKEKIVASSAKQFIVVVDHTKQVPILGGSFPANRSHSLRWGKYRKRDRIAHQEPSCLARAERRSISHRSRPLHCRCPSRSDHPARRTRNGAQFDPWRRRNRSLCRADGCADHRHIPRCSHGACA